MATQASDPRVVAFLGERLLGTGELSSLFSVLEAASANEDATSLCVFDAATSERIEVGPRVTRASGYGDTGDADASSLGSDGHDASAAASAAASATAPPRSPGRPRLGVVAREVTLLPRHWDWLSAQPGGSSAALRRLVDQARTVNVGRDRTRRAQEYAYRFMSATLGDHPGFEEATRALFAGDRDRFLEHSESWPIDLRTHARHLADAAFPT